MTISPVSNSSAALSYSSINNDRQNFQDLVNSIQSGDLSAAQQAFASLQDVSSLPASSPLAQDFAAIGSAITSGNVSDAQQALQTLQADAQKTAGAHGHHHHHHAKPAGAANDQTNPLDPTQDATSTFKITV